MQRLQTTQEVLHFGFEAAHEKIAHEFDRIPVCDMNIDATLESGAQLAVPGSHLGCNPGRGLRTMRIGCAATGR